jgi:hypothetical protein
MSDYQMKTQQKSVNINAMQNDDELNKYLNKLVELVPYLKNNSLLTTTTLSRTADETNASLLEKLENFKYLNIHASDNHLKSQDNLELSELQILQSALDYIGDLQEEIYFLNNNNSQDNS